MYLPAYSAVDLYYRSTADKNYGSTSIYEVDLPFSTTKGNVGWSVGHKEWLTICHIYERTGLVVHGIMIIQLRIYPHIHGDKYPRPHLGAVQKSYHAPI